MYELVWRNMRLDKFLCELNIGSRSQVKDYIRRGQVSVNGQTAQKGEQQIRETEDIIAFQGRSLSYQPYVYYLLNKPGGVVSATADRRERTVLELLPEELLRKDLAMVGRLDKDTEGLLLLTNDGALAHRLLAPKRHVDKTYLVTMAHELTAEQIRLLETGVSIGEERPTLPASVKVCPGRRIELTIHEGRFHQVKRMLKAVDNEVLALKRIAFGPLKLDKDLPPGAYRELTLEEVRKLQDA